MSHIVFERFCKSPWNRVSEGDLEKRETVRICCKSATKVAYRDLNKGRGKSLNSRKAFEKISGTKKTIFGVFKKLIAGSKPSHPGANKGMGMSMKIPTDSLAGIAQKLGIVFGNCFSQTIGNRQLEFQQINDLPVAMQIATVA